MHFQFSIQNKSTRVLLALSRVLAFFPCFLYVRRPRSFTLANRFHSTRLFQSQAQVKYEFNVWRCFQVFVKIAVFPNFGGLQF